MATNFFAALLETVASTTSTAAEAYAHTHPAKKGKKKGPGCTPCAVNARVMDAKARAGFGPGGG